MPQALSRRLPGAAALTAALLGGCHAASMPQPIGPFDCDDAQYPAPSASQYVLPYAVGSSYATGLTNCSSSYHASGNADQFAFDFNMPAGTHFTAARGGRVHRVVEYEPSDGGGVGNYVIIDHRDGTFGLYYHAPRNGIGVVVGQVVQQGDILGLVGRSGLAGYPHLHFIVVHGDPSYPYQGVPISFRNATPSDPILQGGQEYQAAPY